MDHCTGWWEGTWAACCAIHDSMYAQQFTTKLQADIDLMRCVAEHGGWPMALLMFAGVSLFGGLFWRKARRKPQPLLKDIAMDRTVPLAAARILDFIRETEVGTDGPSGYGVIYGHNQSKLPEPLTRMTIDEVIGAQASWTKRFGSSAAGGYQFMRATLSGLKQELGLRGTQILDPDLQDRLGYHLLKRRGYAEFMSGRITRTEFGKRLAQEWASFPVLSDTRGAHQIVSRGQSYYAGDKLNKALVKPEEVEGILEEMKILGDILPAPVAIPEPRPEIVEPDPPPAVSVPTTPEPVTKPSLTPIEQANKAVGAAKWGALATALWTAIVAADVLPPAFTTPEFQAAMSGVIVSIVAAIGAYQARDKRFT